VATGAAVVAEPEHRHLGVGARYPHFARAALVGVLAGLLAVAFQWAMAIGEGARNEMLEYLHALPGSGAWGWAALPLIGLVVGCGVGYMVHRLSPDASGSGIPHIKGVLVNLRELRWRALVPVKFVGGVLSVGVGLSAGREGPTVQMGAAVGKMVAEWLGVPKRAIPQLVSCGAGAGLAAAFNAPLAGFLFVLEELHREMSALTFGGALIAAVVADIVARTFTGQLPTFAILASHPFDILPLGALPAAAVLGALGGLAAVGFNASVLGTQRWALSTKRVPRWTMPGIAGVICGLAAWWYPAAVGGGHATAEQVLTGHFTQAISALCVLMVVKYVLTMVTYASGAPGGVFAPMLLMGAVMGSVYGRGVEGLFPSLSGHLPAFAVLGMAALFTGSVRAPLTGMVLILEMTGNYNQLLALSVTCLTATLVADACRSTPIYEALLEEDLARRGIAAAEGEEPRAVVVGIHTGSSVAGKTLREAGFPAGCLVVMVERAGREIMPRAALLLAPGDHITVLVPAEEPQKALEVVDMCVQR
jgi:CIC family chloride channel protein